MFYCTHLDAYSKPGASIQFCGAKPQQPNDKTVFIEGKSATG